MTTCDCIRYPPLELDNASIYRRIQESKVLLGRFELVVAHPDGELRLFCCLVCGQHWQSSRARLWGNNPYLFKVPSATYQDWLNSAYVSPDEVLEYNKSIRQFRNGQTFEKTERPCKHSSCANQAIELSVMCFQHHMEMLQSGGTLPAKPKGLMFEPYDYHEEEMLYATSTGV